VPSPINLIYAHPYPNRSRANSALLGAVQNLAGVGVRSLYDRYPDFAIDVEQEQKALLEAELVVWQHPLYWYTVPALLKHWFEKVLARGWAYGAGGTALVGKRCLWVTTTGSDAGGYAPNGMHGHEFEAFVPVVKQTALFCGMRWEEPLIVHGAHKIGDLTLAELAATYRARLERVRSSS
jgi:glutathione-regulated potassium-efflux system ancillary protein KefF